jgi:hypothetical protein
MADLNRAGTSELHLLKKEIEVQGEVLSDEKLERRAEVDQLRLEIDTLKKAIDRIHPGFEREFRRIYDEERESHNPEIDRKANEK